MATGKKKRYTLSKAFDYLDNLEVSSSDEFEDEDDDKLISAQIFIQDTVNCIIWTEIPIQEMEM